MVRDARGQLISLARVRADANIAIPELLPRVASFPAIPATQAGSNLFYIRQTTYSERRDTAPTLELLLDQVDDYAAADLVRLRYEEQLRQRSARRSVAIQPSGMSLKGFWSVRWGASSGAGNVWGSAVSFPSILSGTPTSLTFTTIASSNVASGPTSGNFTQWGCDASVTASAAGAGFWIGTYVTVGN